MYEHYASRSHIVFVFLNFLPSVTSSWQLCTLLGWEQH